MVITNETEVTVGKKATLFNSKIVRDGTHCGVIIFEDSFPVLKTIQYVKEGFIGGTSVEGIYNNRKMCNKVETAHGVKKDSIEGSIGNVEGMGYTFGKEEGGNIMGTVRALALGGCLGLIPNVSVGEGKVRVKAFGKDGAV